MVESSYTIDLVVDSTVVVELKAVDAVIPVHKAQLLTYLKLTGDPRMEGRDPWQAYPYRQTTGFGATFNSTLSEQDRKAARERATHKPE